MVLALASAGSTAGASAALHLTQSAVSRALLVTEEKLDTKLFERTARGLTPTAAGERLLAGAGGVLAQLVALEDATCAPFTPQRMRIVCECYTAYRWLPSALTTLHARLPQLEVTLAIEHTADPVTALANGDVDVALLTTGKARGAVREEPLFSDEIVFVVARSHPLASRAAITAQDLCDYPVVCSNTPPAEQAWFEKRVFGRKKPKLELLRLPLTEAIIDAARAGMGIAVLSEWIASTYLDRGDLVAKGLASAPLKRPWRIAYRDDAAPAARRLASALEGLPPRVHTGETRSALKLLAR